MITYSNVITALTRSTGDISGFSEVVVAVYCALRGDDADYSFSVPRVLSIDPPPTGDRSFVPYDSLKYDNINKWIEDIDEADPTWLKQQKAVIEAQIELQKSPPVIVAAPPWDD